ncbi:uncharacterized protein LOC143995860 [Lithobates pipiens]
MSSRARVVNIREAVDSESLIRYIRERTCLYDKTDTNYKDQQKRDNAWLEICRLFYEDWDVLSQTDRSDKLITLQTCWKGLRDCYKRYLRKIQESRSGSGSKRVVSYVHADEMEFVRPFMELGETQSSLEDQRQAQQAGGEAACVVEGGAHFQPLADSPNQIQTTQETEIGESSSQVPEVNLPEVGHQQVEQPARPIPQQSARLGRHSQNMDQFASLMETMHEKLESLESEESGFGIMVAGVIKRVPQERQGHVKKAIIDLLEANMVNQPATAPSPMFGPPPPSGPFYDFPNPPPPRTHPYYTPRFRPYTDNYGNAINQGNAPSPIHYQPL